MFACLDVHYQDQFGAVACLTFTPIEIGAPLGIFTAVSAGVAAYVPGQFYRRELPLLLKGLAATGHSPTGFDALIIDSYVDLVDGQPGLGRHLYDALAKQTPVIGVVKSRFRAAPAVELLRGRSRSPLFITAAGIENKAAAELIGRMAGPYRIPTLLKQVDQICRQTSNYL